MASLNRLTEEKTEIKVAIVTTKTDR